MKTAKAHILVYKIIIFIPHIVLSGRCGIILGYYIIMDYERGEIGSNRRSIELDVLKRMSWHTFT